MKLKFFYENKIRERRNICVLSHIDTSRYVRSAIMEFIASSRGNKPLLILDGYVYSKHRRLSNNVISWECINRRNKQSCIAKMDDLEVGRLHAHTCVPDPEKVKVMKLRSEMKTRTKETMDKTRDILNNAVGGQTQQVLGLLPSEETMR